MEEKHNHLNIISLTAFDIQTLNVKKVINHIKSGGSSHHCKAHILIEGYNLDKRELFEIKEVKSFFKKLCKKYSGWLSPLITMDTIRLVSMCLLHKVDLNNKSLGKDKNGNFNLNISEKDWIKLITKWVSVSEYGKEFASHLAFEAFPNACPVENFTTTNQNYILLTEMLERGYDTSQKLIDHKFCGVKVYAFNELDISIKVYTKKKGVFKTFGFNLNNPVLEIQESIEEFKASYDIEIIKVLNYLES